MHREIKALRQRMAEIVNESKALAASGSEDDSKKLDALAEESREVAEKIRVAETKIEERANSGTMWHAGDGTGEITRPMNPGHAGGPAQDRRYAAMFARSGQTLDRGGFNSMQEFFAAIHGGLADPRLAALQVQAMQTGVPSSGGFAVPDEWAGWILDAALESEIVRPRCQVWPMTSQTRRVPGWNASDHTSGLFGGFAAAWESELATLGESEGELRQIELVAKKLACLVPMSNELLADGLDFEAQLSAAISRTVSWYLDYACLRGSGAGEPLGVLNDPALVTVSKESGQASNSLLYENTTKMLARLAPQCFKNSVWLASQTLVPSLLTMTVAVGTGGTVLAMQEANGEYHLHTRPVIFTEKLPVLGQANCLTLVDLSQYALGLRKGMQLDKSSHVGFVKDMTYYRALLRADGQGTWNAAITPKHGDSLSWVVGLEATA